MFRPQTEMNKRRARQVACWSRSGGGWPSFLLLPLRRTKTRGNETRGEGRKGVRSGPLRYVHRNQLLYAQQVTTLLTESYEKECSTQNRPPLIRTPQQIADNKCEYACSSPAWGVGDLFSNQKNSTREGVRFFVSFFLLRVDAGEIDSQVGSGSIHRCTLTQRRERRGETREGWKQEQRKGLELHCGKCHVQKYSTVPESKCRQAGRLGDHGKVFLLCCICICPCWKSLVRSGCCPLQRSPRQERYSM